MGELVTFQYGNFAILGEQVKEFTQRTGCSNRVANHTLRGQLYLSNLEENTQAGIAPKARNGVYSCWSACSITQPP